MKHIDWPELRFPPINLWVIAALPQAAPSTRTHRQQRPVFTITTGGEKMALHHLKSEGVQPCAWLQNRQQQIQQLLAAR